jgi:exonuclease III
VKGGVWRVVCWNLAYGKPGRFHSHENRRRQWALLGALAPDIALLQECRPTDLEGHAPAWMADVYRCVGLLQPGWKLCTSVLVRDPLKVEPLDPAAYPDPERRWLEYMFGAVVAAIVRCDGVEFAVASVHAAGGELSDTAITSADHEQVRRTTLRRAWYNDLAAAALVPFVQGRRFLVGGDWNTALVFDEMYPSRAGASAAEFFERRRAAGWCDAMRKFHDDEVRTYLDPRSGSYELDRVFIDPTTFDTLVGCHGLDDAALSGLSDHAPVVVEIEP